ncbi:MAG: 30S ribosomal protein S12 methylthiotransferase RimO [Acidimicrobiia bacterium]|nr:30S ribosomal protein S12 methylthiotransferase RimO [Acidimicrobiia bacterium]
MTPGEPAEAPARFFVETLGCPKNAVDSDKVVGSLLDDGLVPAGSVGEADLVVVNTCAFVEEARTESIDVTLALDEARKPGSRLVVTGCLAEHAGDELAAALPEVDAVVGFAGEGWLAPVEFVRRPVESRRRPAGVRDLLELPRPAPRAPWAYLKVAEGCDRACAFCAIPSFRGRQRSRTPESIETEARHLVEGGVRELVLVAQDIAWYGRDVGEPHSLEPLLRRLDALRPHGLERVRMLYLYPSEVRDPLISTVLELDTTVPYFDLSLQHASAPLLRSMRRWGSGDLFLAMLERVRADEPDAAFRSSFILGHPGETEADHDELLAFLDAAHLDWAGFFRYSAEDGTPSADMEEPVTAALADARLRECSELQDPITATRREALIGRDVTVLVDTVLSETVVENEAVKTAVGRTHREAPEIDGVVTIRGPEFAPGDLVEARVTGALGPDLDTRVINPANADPAEVT